MRELFVVRCPSSRWVDDGHEFFFESGRMPLARAVATVADWNAGSTSCRHTDHQVVDLKGRVVLSDVTRISR